MTSGGILQSWQHCGVSHPHNPHAWSFGGTDMVKSCPGSIAPVSYFAAPTPDLSGYYASMLDPDPTERIAELEAELRVARHQLDAVRAVLADVNATVYGWGGQVLAHELAAALSSVPDTTTNPEELSEKED